MINFTATTQDNLSFVWDFNDGNVLNTTDSTISYTYTIPGNYLPKLILIDTGISRYYGGKLGWLEIVGDRLTPHAATRSVK